MENGGNSYVVGSSSGSRITSNINKATTTVKLGAFIEPGDVDVLRLW